jgi:hypothetical protein
MDLPGPSANLGIAGYTDAFGATPFLCGTSHSPEYAEEITGRKHGLLHGHPMLQRQPPRSFTQLRRRDCECGACRQATPSVSPATILRAVISTWWPALSWCTPSNTDGAAPKRKGALPTRLFVMVGRFGVSAMRLCPPRSCGWSRCGPRTCESRVRRPGGAEVSPALSSTPRDDTARHPLWCSRS